MFNLKSLRRSPRKIFLLARFLLTKFYCNKEILSDIELFLLNESIISLGEVNHKDFKRKYGFKVKGIILLTTILNRRNQLNEILHARKEISLMRQNLDGIFMTYRMYYGVKENFDKIIISTRNSIGQRKEQKLPPKRFLGRSPSSVGTRRKNPKIDGLPTWQEIANCRTLENKLFQVSNNKERLFSFLFKEKSLYEELDDSVQLILRHLDLKNDQLLKI